jgi:hypothetical protein
MNILFAQGFQQGFPQGAGAQDTGSIMTQLIITAVFAIFYVACGWVIFTKAGEPGWASIIPIYNYVVLTKIAGKPIWWFLLLLVPCVGLIVAFVLAIGLAKNFGRSALFGVGLLVPPFSLVCVPMLAFGSDKFDPVEMDGQPVGGGRRRRDDDYDDDRPRSRRDDDDDDRGRRR